MPVERRLRTLTLMLVGLAWATPFGTTGAVAQRAGFTQPEGPKGDADKPVPFPEPEVSTAVTDLLGQAYLTPEERRALRVRHGLWTEEDLADASARASAAVVLGKWADAALEDPAADPLDRAEGAIRVGAPAEALRLLAESDAPRATRLRAEALIELGRADEARETLLPLVGVQSATADEVAEVARGLVILARLVGPESGQTVGYQELLGRLGEAREELDRLSWAVSLAEAQLLYEKDRYGAVGEALQTTLTLNPKASEAWALLGMASVDGFDFGKAEAVALRLDLLAGEPGSMDAAIIRAAVRLRQSEGEEAEAILRPWVERWPDHRRLLAWWAAAAAGRFDFEEADRRLARLDAISPRQSLGHLVVGKAMAGSRQYVEASGYLREASARWPRWAEPQVELGLSDMQAGRTRDAEAALDRALSLDRFNIRAENSLKLLRELNSYATIESEHFIVRYKPGVDEVLALEMPAVLERLHARVTGSGRGGIDHVPAGRTSVELYPDHQWFSVRITGMPRLHTIAAATGPVIAMEAPREGPGHKVGTYDWARVVQHEFTHTVTLSRTKNRLPHWFTEAGAVLLEDAPRDYNTVRLLAGAYEAEALFDFEQINIAFVRPKKPTDRSLAYAQGHWMYEYIIERWGNAAPLSLMDLYASGVREPQAFEQVLGVTREEFMAAFKTWAGGELREWGMLPTDEQPGVVTLLSRDAAEEATPELIERWLAEQPDNPAVLEAAVRQREEAGGGRLTGADVDLCERYARARPVDPRPHRLLAAYWLASAESGRAVPHLEWLDAREQSTAVYATQLARLYVSGGDLARAMAKAARAVEIAPYDARTREFAATVSLRAKDLDTAERHVRALVVLEPDRPVHAQRLDALLEMKRSQGR
jgi:tetratricopeptide (TPR) repeat protein